jgi:hypothetical protein
VARAPKPKAEPSAAPAPAETANPGLMPLEYMLMVVRDESVDLAKRLDAAKAAVPYLHPRLTTVKVGNEDDRPFEQVIRWAISDDEATPDPAAR